MEVQGLLKVRRLQYCPWFSSNQSIDSIRPHIQELTIHLCFASLGSVLDVLHVASLTKQLLQRGSDTSSAVVASLKQVYVRNQVSEQNKKVLTSILRSCCTEFFGIESWIKWQNKTIWKGKWHVKCMLRPEVNPEIFVIFDDSHFRGLSAISKGFQSLEGSNILNSR